METVINCTPRDVTNQQMAGDLPEGRAADASVNAFISRTLQYSPLILWADEETELRDFEQQLGHSTSDLRRSVAHFPQRIMLKSVIQVLSSAPSVPGWQPRSNSRATNPAR
jgi:hypothetical protein